MLLGPSTLHLAGSLALSGALAVLAPVQLPGGGLGKTGTGGHGKTGGGVAVVPGSPKVAPPQGPAAGPPATPPGPTGRGGRQEVVTEVPGDFGLTSLDAHAPFHVDGNPILGVPLVQNDRYQIFSGPFLAPKSNPDPIDLPDDVFVILIGERATPTAWAEEFILRAPATLGDGPAPLFVGFHSFASGPGELLGQTNFVNTVHARGWFFLAPLGAADENFASIDSQLNTEFVLDLVMNTFGNYIDRERVYGVGFSMGAATGMNFAARHVDPAGLMFAAFVNHTGGVALRHTYATASPTIRTILEFWFGGGPIDEAFNYRRSSVIDYTLGTKIVFPDESMCRNLVYMPIYDVRSENDPQATLIEQNEIFETFMATLGADITTEIKTQAVHNWSTLHERDALDFLEQHRLEMPTSGRTLADRDARFFHFDVVQDAGGAFSPFTWSIGTRGNRVNVDTTSNLTSLALSPLDAGLDYTRILRFDLASGDATTDLFIVEDFWDPPVEVLLDDVTTASWSHDAQTGRLTLTDTDPAVNTWKVYAEEATADLGVRMSVDDTVPLENQTVSYRITLTNGGPVEATGVQVTDLVPAGLTFLSATPSQGTYDDQTGIWTVGAMAWAARETLVLALTTDVASGGATILNTATASATQLDSDATNDSDTVSIVVDDKVDIAVAKTVDNDRPKEGEQVVFSIGVRNIDPSAQATNVSLTDVLPSGLTYVSDNPTQGSYASGTGIWTIGTLDSDQVETLQLTASVDLGTVGNTIINTTSNLQVDQLDRNGANNTGTQALLVVDDIDFSLTKIVDDATPVEQGTVVYTLTITNTSATLLGSSIQVTDLLPAGVTFVNGSPSQGQYIFQTGVWNVGMLAALGNATLDITATADEGTGGSAIVNSASITGSDQPDPNATNDSDSAQIDVDPDADLALTVVVDDATPLEQDQVVYTLTISNPVGGAQATSVVVTDLLPAGVTYVSDVPSQGSYVDGTGVWTVGALNAGSNATLAITASVDVGTGGQAIVNSGSITAADQPDPNGTNDSDTAQIDVDDNADLSVTKTVDDDKPKETEQVVFTITVANASGGAQASNVSLTDLLPTGLTYFSDNPSQGSYVPGTGAWTVGTIDTGSNATLDITATVDVATIGQTIVNTANGLALDQTDPNATNDSDSASLLVVDDIDLSIVVVADDVTPTEQSSVVYTITVTNTHATASATNVTVSDLLPAGVTYVSDVPSQGSYVDGTGVWTVGTIAGLADATLDITVSVDVATGGTSIIDSASITGLDQPDPNATNDSDSVQIDVENDADLSVTKVVDDATPTEQQTIVYTITVASPVGAAQATNVSLTDLLPSGVTYVSDNPSQGTYVPGTGVWTIGTVDASSNETLEITATVDVATGGDAIVNTANGLTLDQDDPAAGNDSDTAQIDVENDADLSVTKVVDDAVPAEQGTVVYTITVASPAGAAQATNVSLTDLLPTGVTYVSDVPSQGSYVPGTGVWTIGTVDASSNETLAITATVDVATGGSAIVNTANGLALDQTDPNATNDSDTAQIDVENDADLAVTKVVDVPAPLESDTVIYTVTVANPVGGARATNVSLTDLLPSGVTYVSDVPSQGGYVSGTGVWTIGTIDAGSDATLDITATVDVATGGSAIVNTATLTALDQTDPNATNDSDTAQIDVDDEADLSVMKIVDDATPAEQQQVVYTITLENTAGGAQATNVSLTDLLPSGVTYVSDNPSQGSYVPGTGVWTVGTVDTGNNATLGITASVDVGSGGDVIANTATVTALDQTDSTSANDSDQASITVEDDADLSVTKVVDDATPTEQGTVVYTITVASPVGAAQATNVSLTDLLPSGVTYVSDVPSQGSYVPGTGVWTVGTVDANSNETLAITATVDVATGGTAIVNTANGLTLDQTDPNATNDSDTAQIDVENDADLSVTKVVDDATPTEQGTVVYTITVASPVGAAQATNVSLTDLLPSGVTYVSDVPSQGSYVPGTGVWTVGTVDANSNETLAITATVDVATGGTAIVNTANGLTLDQTDSNATNDSDTAQIDVENDADLSVTKVVDDATPTEQGTVVYTITVASPVGAAQATNVSLTDLLPSGVTYVSDNPSQGTYVPGTGVWTVGTVDASSNETLEITATVDVATGGDAIVNTANGLTLDQNDPAAGNDSDTAQIDVEDDADLSVTKTVDDATPIEQGTVVYTITVASPAGAAQATNVSLTDLLPSGVTYVSDNPSQGSYVSGTGVWTVGTVDANSNETLEITATVDVGTGGDAIVNTANGLTLDQNDPTAGNDSDTAQIDVEDDADISVSKVVDDSTPDETDTIVYTITVTNTSGGAQATNVSITDVLPTGVTYSSDNPSQGSFVSGTGVWTVGTINSGSNATLDITVTVDTGTTGQMITNQTSALTADQNDPTASNDVGSVTLTVN